MNYSTKGIFTCLLLFVFFTSGLVFPLVSPSIHAKTTNDCRSVQIYWRTGCPHCDAAHTYLELLQQQYSELDIEFLNIHESKNNRARFEEINRQYEIKHPGVPTLLICDELMIGFDKPETTGVEIKRILGLIAHEDKEHEKDGDSIGSVTLPWLGEISVASLGLPTFTLLIGLIDGFNPCAMWVLLFLLSILVNVKQRSKIILIAGTFVVVSGLVYFAFMAAWLNLFMILGWSRVLQITLASFALIIGSIHIKDFFAFQQGISLSIPVKYKPDIYRKVRKIVNSHNLGLSMVSVAVMAAMVNLIELLCTAGLPAIYSQILSQHSLTTSQHYGYLALYNLAYIFDDAIMVTLAIVTLQHKKLQIQQGRWLKLLTGTVILILATLLMFKPRWLF